VFVTEKQDNVHATQIMVQESVINVIMAITNTQHVQVCFYSLLFSFVQTLIILFTPSACDCDPKGTVDEICNKLDGTCLCKEGFGGPRCDRCEPGTKINTKPESS